MDVSGGFYLSGLHSYFQEKEIDQDLFVEGRNLMKRESLELKDQIFALMGLNENDLRDLGEGIDPEGELEAFFEEGKEDEELRRIIKREGGHEEEEELQEILEGGLRVKNIEEEDEIERLINQLRDLD